MQRRLALVVGNGAYAHYRRLPNPENDAADISAALKDLGFGVAVEVDLGHFAMEDALEKFELAAPDSDVALFFYAGHGLQVGGKNYLIPVDAEIREVKHLSRAFELGAIMSRMAKSKRCNLTFLDACRDNPYALTPSAGATEGRTRSLLRSGLAKVEISGGSFIAFATEPDEVALDGDGRNSPFTGALLRHIKIPNLSINDMMIEVRKSVRETTRKTGKEQIPWEHSSMLEQFFFVEPEASADTQTGLQPNPGSAAGKYAALDALDRAAFADGDAALNCVVITAELPRSSMLDTHVRRALEHHSEEIEKAAMQLRQRENPPIEPMQSRRLVLDPTRAFASIETLQLAVNALCRAEIAVFDITQLQPGVMLLLGIRSVARRGVTVCSYGDDYVHGGGLQLPFNLQMLNVAAHSDAQANNAKSRPLDIIGRKIVRGLQELARMPDYMDLPAYDPVRALGPTSFEPILIRDKVLVLCPFTPRYQSRNWSMLQDELTGKLALRNRGNRPAPQGMDSSDLPRAAPVLVRLLDEETPRLVAQTLYELIRRVDMCVVDWTGLRPNVMFELGVRLAVNRLGAVHIIDTAEVAESEADPMETRRGQLKQAGQLQALFKPIQYSSKQLDPECFDRMVDSFAAGYTKERIEDSFIYRAVGASIGVEPRSAFLPVVDELVERASLLANRDEEGTGTSSVLYQDVSATVLAQARTAAIERRVAAWLFLDARHSNEDFQGDATLSRRFRALGTEILLSFSVRRKNSQGASDAQTARVEQRIRARLKELRR
ncbi:MAG: caspase domain-containing protein [Hyphomicrobiales bacterium]